MRRKPLKDEKVSALPARVFHNDLVFWHIVASGGTFLDNARLPLDPGSNETFAGLNRPRGDEETNPKTIGRFYSVGSSDVLVLESLKMPKLSIG